MLDWLQPLKKILYPQYEGRIRVFYVAAQCSTVWTRAYKWLHTYVPTPLCSDCSTYVPTPLCSDWSTYVPTPLCSDCSTYVPTPLCSDCSTYVPTPICSETPMFRLLNLCSDIPMCRHPYVPTPLQRYVPTPYMWDWVTNPQYFVHHSTVINVG